MKCLGREKPLLHGRATHTERIGQILAGAGSKSIQRKSEAVDT
jgi:hypothetical protein